MSAQEFWDIDPLELDCKLKGFDEYHESMYREQCELSRWQSWMLINIQLPLEDKIKDPVTLFRFSWEPEQKTKLPDKSVEDRIMKKFKIVK